MKIFKTLLISSALSVMPFMAYSADYIAVNKEGKLYDQSNTKYVTENQNGDEVTVMPGMVFMTMEHLPGWYKIEYSPGLHAFLPEQIVATTFKNPVSGSYKVTNNPGETVQIQNSVNQWTVTSKGKTYKGILNGNIVIFSDDNNKLQYSLTDTGNGPIVITYDNDVTKFF